jgi:hypothetical protein
MSENISTGVLSSLTHSVCVLPHLEMEKAFIR